MAGRSKPVAVAAETTTTQKAMTAAETRAATMAGQRAHFLKLLAQTANVSRAAREAGIPSSTVYRARARSAAFARDWDAAIGEALDALEETLIQRARDGVEKPVFYGGQQTGTVRVYSDQLAMFMLRAKRPEVYDRVTALAPPVQAMNEAEAKAEFERRVARVRDAGDGG